jgi:glycogen operon protein
MDAIVTAETTWFDWSAVARHADIHRFVQQLIAFRKTRTLPRARFEMTLNELIAQHPVEWHGIALGAPDWGDDSHSLAATVRIDADALALHLMINSYWEPLAFAIPPLDEKSSLWRRCIDTSRAAPEDTSGWNKAQAVRDGTFVVQPRSIVLLVSKSTDAGMQS